MSRSVAMRFLTAGAFASVIEGLALSYQGHTADPRLSQVVPASAETMQLLRDEHGLVADMIKAQVGSRLTTAAPH